MPADALLSHQNHLITQPSQFAVLGDPKAWKGRGERNPAYQVIPDLLSFTPMFYEPLL
jgi:hypothetical protein